MNKAGIGRGALGALDYYEEKKDDNDEPTANPKLWEKAWDLVFEAHPIKCVCGRLCTGLHEYQCSSFYKSVKRKYESLLN